MMPTRSGRGSCRPRRSSPRGTAVSSRRQGSAKTPWAWRELGREVEVGLVLYDLGWGHFFAGENDAARSRLEASLQILINRRRICGH